MLTRYDDTLTMDKIVSFISAREASKRCQVQLMSNASASRISPYQRSKMSWEGSQTSKSRSRKRQNEGSGNTRPCGWCSKVGHGARSDTEVRRKLCPAFGKTCSTCSKVGHFSSACRSRNVKNSYLEPCESVYEHDTSACLGGVDCLDENVAVSSLTSLSAVPHMEHSSRRGWFVGPSKEDPVINLEIATHKEPYDKLNIPFPPSRSAVIPVVADTGARTTVAGRALLGALGLDPRRLCKTEVVRSK